MTQSGHAPLGIKGFFLTVNLNMRPEYRGSTGDLSENVEGRFGRRCT
jgi:hypothetical protein